MKRAREQAKEEKSSKKKRLISSSRDEEDTQARAHLEPGEINEAQLPAKNGTLAESISSDDYDEDLLQAIKEPEAVEFSDDLHADVASKFQLILANGLDMKSRKELMKKHLIPRNVPLAKAPILNPELEVMLREKLRYLDHKLFYKQEQLGRALSALGKAMTGLLRKRPDIRDVISTLNDAGKLIADSHYAETHTRRTVINKSLTAPFKNRTRDSFLFGEGLGEVINLRGTKNVNRGYDLNRPGPSSRPEPQTYSEHRSLLEHERRLQHDPRARHQSGLPLPPHGRSPAQRHPRTSTDDPWK